MIYRNEHTSDFLDGLFSAVGQIGSSAVSGIGTGQKKLNQAKAESIKNDSKLKAYTARFGDNKAQFIIIGVVVLIAAVILFKK